MRAFKKGLASMANEPLAHSSTACATELANANVSVYTLMKLLGHESMVTSQRYVDGARRRHPHRRRTQPPVRASQNTPAT
ncbi:hypothetical protein [Mycolicibacterium arabiense]|uniref:hypothetical protein n=1 Tax=Mycolicibacterium arabiense TaxID=1286181 RepID=UPI003898F166